MRTLFLLFIPNLLSNPPSCRIILDFPTEEQLMIAKALHHEACAEIVSHECANAFVSVVWNRVNLGSKRGFRNSVREVLEQKGQFKGFPKWKPPCSKCIKQAMNYTPIQGITHYTCKYDSNTYRKKIKVFYKTEEHLYGTFQTCQ